MNKIISLFILFPFILVSMGMTIYQSHCNCTGKEEISFYVAPETCNSDIHSNHNQSDQDKESCCSMEECPNCMNHLDDCGCSAPTVKYIKLTNQVIQEDSLSIKIKLLTPLVLLTFIDSLVDIQSGESLKCNDTPDPPLLYNCSEFLNLICQHKIPLIA